MKEITFGPSVNTVQGPGNTVQSPTGPNLVRPQAGQRTFGNFLRGAINKVEHDHHVANRSVEDLAMNKGKEIHRTMIEMEKAEISFKLLMQVRNKIVSAYETIMRMPV